LHLQLREFEPTFGKTTSLGSKTTIPAAKGRWILGFSNADYCNAAYSAILEEARKQRSFIESSVHRLLPMNSF
jgi:protein CLEC16A